MGAAEQALQCARRAVEIDPQSAYAQFALFEASFFNRDVSAAKQAAKRALELNPRDTDSMAMIGILLMFLGDWETGFASVKRAIQLNPNGPGWYRFGGFYHHYRKGEFEQALDFARSVDMPQYHACHSTLAIALVECGFLDEAKEEANKFRELWPVSMDGYTENFRRWFFVQPELTERMTKSLAKAGLELP